jgi:hypothetical protein
LQFEKPTKRRGEERRGEEMRQTTRFSRLLHAYLQLKFKTKIVKPQFPVGTLMW